MSRSDYETSRSRKHRRSLYCQRIGVKLPLISSADRLLLPLGIPLLYLYIFLVWLAIIVLMALIVERKDLHSDEKAESRDA
ncbi:MAG: hypothetical protein R3F37_09640 [Candidatus Competibacteraceae bacterium]